MENGAKQQLAKIVLPDGTEIQLPILQVSLRRCFSCVAYEA